METCVRQLSLRAWRWQPLLRWLRPVAVLLIAMAKAAAIGEAVIVVAAITLLVGAIGATDPTATDRRAPSLEAATAHRGRSSDPRMATETAIVATHFAAATRIESIVLAIDRSSSSPINPVRSSSKAPASIKRGDLR